MHNYSPRPTRSITLPNEGGTTCEVIRLLRDECVVVRISYPDSHLYVNAPETDGIINEFPVIRVDSRAEHRQRTSLGPLALTCALRQRDWQLIAPSQTPFAPPEAQR